MKKSIFSVCFMALFALTLCSFTPDLLMADDDKPVVVTMKEPGSFSAGVFGCWGSGFCYRDVIIDDGTASVITNNEDGTVTIDYNFEAFNAENQAYYQSHSEHEVPEGGTFTAEELAGLELPEGTVIEGGAYPVELAGSRMLVTYNIR